MSVGDAKILTYVGYKALSESVICGPQPAPFIPPNSPSVASSGGVRVNFARFVCASLAFAVGSCTSCAFRHLFWMPVWPSPVQYVGKSPGIRVDFDLNI